MRSSINQLNLTANTRSSNLLAGNINEFIPQKSVVTFYLKSSATGIKATILASSDVSSDSVEINSIGTSLAIPDDLFDSFVVGPGTRLALFLQETAGVSTTDIIGAVDVQPMG